MRSSQHLYTPFTILIDTAEQHPFSFAGMKADAAKGGQEMVPRIERRCLGRHPESLGDYSLDDCVGRCHVERKSIEDCQGTILGFAKEGDGFSRRERFERELSNLSKVIDAGGVAMVVVEGEFVDVVSTVRETPNRTAAENAKTLMRSILAYLTDYRVPWAFLPDRRTAEIVTFRVLERFWRKRCEAEKEVEKLVGAM